MTLDVIGTGSKGNGYLLKDSEGRCLLIEAGTPLREALRLADWKPKAIEGCLVTHEHGDHARHVAEVLDGTNARVLMTAGTLEALEARTAGARRSAEAAAHGETHRLGPYEAMAVAAAAGGRPLHDAADPACWLVRHEEMGTMLFATDLYALPSTRWEGLETLMVECNYDPEILEENRRNGTLPEFRYRRAVVSHMGLHTLLGQLGQTDLSRARKIVLLHASSQNGDRERFVREVERKTGVPTLAAARGMRTDLSRV